MILGQIAQFSHNIQQTKKLRVLQSNQEEFKKNIFSTTDPSETEAAYTKYVDSLKDGFSNLSDTSTGNEKHFYKIMGEFINESQVIVQNWQNSFNAIQTPEIQDFTQLKSDEEFDRREKVIRLYIEKTNAYYDFFNNMIPILKKRLSVLGERNQFAIGAVKGARQKYNLQKPIFEPLKQAHLEYGNNFIQLNELLQKNNGEWSFENNTLMFTTDSVLGRFNMLYEELKNNVNLILKYI